MKFTLTFVFALVAIVCTINLVLAQESSENKAESLREGLQNVIKKEFQEIMENLFTYVKTLVDEMTAASPGQTSEPEPPAMEDRRRFY